MRYRIAVIPGDGIGKEVIPRAFASLVRQRGCSGSSSTGALFDWSCATYHATGAMMPADSIDQLAQHDAVFRGAVGYPGVPDHVSLLPAPAHPSAV